MKITVLLLLMFLATPSLFAQEIEEPAKQMNQELGVNATALLTNFLSFNSDLVDPGAYVLTYKRINERGRGFRLGFGVSLNSIEGENSFINFRLGYERQTVITSKWLFYWGIDLVANVGNFNDPTTEISKGVGLGPVIGIQYRINEKIGFSTESSFYFLSKEAGEFEFKAALPSFLIFTIQL